MDYVTVFPDADLFRHAIYLLASCEHQHRFLVKKDEQSIQTSKMALEELQREMRF